MPTKYELDLDRENDTGIWYVYWRGNVRGKVRSGRNSLKTRDKAEADAAFAAFLIRKGEKVETAARNGAIYTIADLWALYVVRLGRGRSYPHAERLWKHCMRQHFGHLTVPQVTDAVVQDYVLKRVSGKLSCPGRGGVKHGKPVAEVTVRNELVLLLACMNYCSQRKHKKKLFDPTLIEAFDMPEPSKPRERALDNVEIDALLAAAARRSQAEGKLSRIEIFLHLAFGTGGREAALRYLTFDRVDFEKGHITLDDGQRLKGDKRRAIVPMNDTLTAVLKRALAESDQSVPLERRYVLGIASTQIWPVMQRVVYEAGLAPKGWVLPPRNTIPKSTGISPHTLRHTVATHMVIKGVPLTHVAEFLGNTVAMVEKVYKHLQPDHLRGAADVMNRGFRVIKDREVA